MRGPAESLLCTGGHLQAAMLKTIRTEDWFYADPRLGQRLVSMASAAAQHAHVGQHTGHTSCAVALVVPAEALAAWEIVSVAALVLQHSAY